MERGGRWGFLHNQRNRVPHLPPFQSLFNNKEFREEDVKPGVLKKRGNLQSGANPPRILLPVLLSKYFPKRFDEWIMSLHPISPEIPVRWGSFARPSLGAAPTAHTRNRVALPPAQSAAGPRDTSSLYFFTLIYVKLRSLLFTLWRIKRAVLPGLPERCSNQNLCLWGANKPTCGPRSVLIVRPHKSRGVCMVQR